jgi:hypothetical protein
MNNRLKELMLEAGYAAPELAGRGQKLAELIVKECAEQSMSIGRYNTPSGITPDLAIAIAVGLKKHFGVEE